MFKPLLDPSALAAICNPIDSPAARDMLRMVDAQAQLVDSPAVRAFAIFAENNERVMKASGLLDSFSVAKSLLNDFSAACRLSGTMSSLALDIKAPFESKEFYRHFDALQASGVVSSFSSRFAELGTAVRMLDLGPYESLRDALAVRGAFENLNAGKLTGSLLSDGAWNHIGRDFERLKDAYDGVLLDPASLTLPFVVDLRLPEVDVATHAGVVRAFEARDDEIEIAEVAADLAADVSESAIRQVEGVSSRLGAKLRSAFKNLGSSDPQAASNACVAIRQVFLALLRMFASEDRVRPWAKQRNDRSLFKNRNLDGETSYQARILYLSRFDLDEESAYASFLVENAKSLVRLLSVVSVEIHDESPQQPSCILTPARVQHILTRAAAAFGELIICAKVQDELDRRKSS